MTPDVEKYLLLFLTLDFLYQMSATYYYTTVPVSFIHTTSTIYNKTFCKNTLHEMMEMKKH